jgi:hypothetical protein
MLWHAFVPDSRQLERANSLLKLPGLITHDLSLCQKPCWCRARFPLCVCECVLSPSPIMSLSSSLSFLAPQRGPPIAENRSTTHRTHRTYRASEGYWVKEGVGFVVHFPLEDVAPVTVTVTVTVRSAVLRQHRYYHILVSSLSKP